MVILITLLILSSLFFFSLQFVEIKLKSPKIRMDQVSTNSVLEPTATTGSNLAEQTLETIQSSTPATEEKANAE